MFLGYTNKLLLKAIKIHRRNLGKVRQNKNSIKATVVRNSKGWALWRKPLNLALEHSRSRTVRSLICRSTWST